VDEATPLPTIERRAEPRCQPEVAVCVTCLASPPDPDPDLGLALLEVSRSGVRLLLRRALDPGQAVTVTLRVPLLPPIRRRGIVRWSSETEDGRCVVGLELSPPLDAGDLARLA
jgi:PilZ domain